MTHTVKRPAPVTDWLKGNIFSIVNLLIIAIGLAYTSGQIQSRLQVVEAQVAESKKVIGDIVINGRPAYETRIAALEHRTDDLSVLKAMVQNQSVQISQLYETVSRDHDLIIRLSAMPKP